MSRKLLPIVQSIPHAGLETPPEVADNLAIDEVTIYNECDLWNNQLFDFTQLDPTDLPPTGYAANTLARVTMPMARVLIDANRPPDSLNDPDGAVKTRTSYGDDIYRDPIDPGTQEMLVERYWHPFHQQIDDALRYRVGQTKLFLDCHNMAQHGPSAYADPDAPRPFICIANNGDTQGEAVADQGALSAPAWLARRAVEIAEELFAELALLEPGPTRPPVALLNQPFVGGYVLRHYSGEAYRRSIGATGENRYYGLMIEVNRGLFVGDQSTRSPVQPPNAQQIAAIRCRLYLWAVRVVELLNREDADGEVT